MSDEVTKNNKPSTRSSHKAGCPYFEVVFKGEVTVINECVCDKLGDNRIEVLLAQNPYCECSSPRDMGYLDTSFKDICGNCEKLIQKPGEEAAPVPMLGVSFEKPAPREITITVEEQGSGRNMIEQVTSLEPGDYHFIEHSAYLEMKTEKEFIEKQWLMMEKKLEATRQEIASLKSFAEAKHEIGEKMQAKIDDQRIDLNGVRIELQAERARVAELDDAGKEMTERMEYYRDRFLKAQARIERLEAALNKWRESFYCDGETKEKAEAKELAFNEFVAMAQALERERGE